MISASSLKHSHDCGHTREIDDLTHTTKEQQIERAKEAWVGLKEELCNRLVSGKQKRTDGVQNTGTGIHSLLSELPYFQIINTHLLWW